MTEAHLVLGVAVLVANLVAGVWGATAWLRRHPSVTFFYLLRFAQATVAIEVLLGAVLVISGREPADGLHYVYGLAPLGVALFAEAARAGAAEREIGDVDFKALDPERQKQTALAIVRRETGIMAISALVIFALALRAAFTSSAF